MTEEVITEPLDVVVEALPVEIIRCKGRPRLHPIETVKRERKQEGRGRPRVEHPTTAGHPKLGKVYFQNYYKEHKQNDMMHCPVCSLYTKTYNLKNHMKSKDCLKIAQLATLTKEWEDKFAALFALNAEIDKRNEQIRNS